MRVLIVHHGRLPAPAQVSSGGALRADSHAVALRSAGHEVWTLARAQDQENGFSSSRDLQQKAFFLAPDWILCVAPEEAQTLAPVAPLVVDLYAPRLLEAAWQENPTEEAGRALQAVQAADTVLFSNARQRWFWLGILGICGWDLRSTPGLLVPLSTRVGPDRRIPDRPRFVIGGQPWPWQDASETIRRAVDFVGDRAEVYTVGLPAFAGAQALPPMAYDRWLEFCAGATAALDRYMPTMERELALSFRQLDFLSAGLPLISAKDSVLSGQIREFGAGWVDEELEVALEAALDPGEVKHRSEGAHRLAAEFRVERTHADLIGWQPERRQRGPSALRSSAAWAAERQRALSERSLRKAAEREVQQKREEVEALHRQQAVFLGTVEAQAAALADVAAFKREVVSVLGTRFSGEQAAKEQLRRELEITHAELEKKTLELEALQSERGRLERVIARLSGRR